MGAVIIVVLFLLPVTICARTSRSDGIVDGSLSISWLILSVKYEVKDKQVNILVLDRTLIHKQNIEKEHKEKKPKIKEKSKKAKSRSVPPVKDFIPLIGPLMRLIRDLLSIFRFRHVKLSTVYGLEDPACTGMLTGYLHALQCQYISFTPDFTQPVLEWDLDLATAFTPIMVVPPITRFAANPRVLRSGWRIIRS